MFASVGFVGDLVRRMGVKKFSFGRGLAIFWSACLRLLRYLVNSRWHFVWNAAKASGSVATTDVYVNCSGIISFFGGWYGTLRRMHVV